VDWLVEPDRLVEVWLVEVWLPEVWLPEVWLPEVWLPEVWLGAVDGVDVAGTEAVSLALVMATVKALVRFAWLLVSASWSRWICSWAVFNASRQAVI